MLDKPIVIHVTNEVFDLFKKGVKKAEYRPQTRYYMQRFEKARDYMALCHNGPYGYMQPHLFLDIRKAYLPKESRDSWLIAAISDISLVKVEDIPETDRKLVVALYKDKFKSGYFKDLLFYRIDLEV